MIELQQITKKFHTSGGEVTALNDVSLAISAGEIFGLVGSSGAGKSTLLRCINLLEVPTAGQVLVEGRNITTLTKRELSERRRSIGMIFQQFNLLEGKTVFDNVALPMRLAKVPEAEVTKRVEMLLGFVELSDKAKTYPGRLSGGQKQRVGIARALANQPSVLLCDEATSALDPETTESILRLLKRVNAELGVTIVVVTHEMQVIARICERVAVMSGGRIVEMGKVIDVFSYPREAITQKFVSTIVNAQVPTPLLSIVDQTTDPHEIWRLTAVGAAVAQPIINDLVETNDVTTRLLYASINEISGQMLSVLIVQVIGSPEELGQARARVEHHGVQVDQVPPRALAETNPETSPREQS